MRTSAKRRARSQAKAVMKKDDESIAEEIDVVFTPEFLSCVSPTHTCMCVCVCVCVSVCVCVYNTYEHDADGLAAEFFVCVVEHFEYSNLT